ncbi:MAG: hypothetical protein WBN36_09855, partial [Gammaproteobacteria bacterium]
FTMNGGFAKLHANGLRWFDWLGGASDSTNSGTVLMSEDNSLCGFVVFSGLHHGCGSAIETLHAAKPINKSVSVRRTYKFMQLSG